MMQRKIESVTSSVVERITPSLDERKKMERLSQTLEARVADACREFGLQATVRLEGSVAKDTWLRGDPDIDIFIRLPTSVSRERLSDLALKVARYATKGFRQIERFAEHPYLEAFVDETRVNIVPCYDAHPGEWLSATDRTPYHTDYINAHLNKSKLNEVRLLKKFMKGINVYGAEIKIGGFSGYLCELLILHFGTFLGVLEAFSNHISRRTIDIEAYYFNLSRDLDLLFPEALVVVDPVDKARNVASAVQLDNLHFFVAASRAFLKSPTKEFFFPAKIVPLKSIELRSKIEARNTCLLFLIIGQMEAVPDIIWGQLHRTRKKLRKQLEISNFKILRDAVWHGENEAIIFVFELEQRILPAVKSHVGPPLEFQSECLKFLAKYSTNKSVTVGPYIDKGRWIVQLKRGLRDSSDFLNAKLKDGGKNMGVADLIATSLRQNFAVLVDDEISEYNSQIEEFGVFLADFLSGKPFWLR
jgi:tRNA nucleotidyltransferase (CCA-adding enzyme)